MQKYIDQLLEDIHYAKVNLPYPWVDQQWSLEDWVPPDEDEKYATKRTIEDGLP